MKKKKIIVMVLLIIVLILIIICLKSLINHQNKTEDSDPFIEEEYMFQQEVQKMIDSRFLQCKR